MSVNESFYNKKIGATQTDPDLALRLALILLVLLYLDLAWKCTLTQLFAILTLA